MSALAFVLAGHFVGDWIVQTDYQAADKVWPSEQWLRYEKRIRGERWATPDKPWPSPHDRDVKRGERMRTWRSNQRHVFGYHLALVLLAAPVWHDWWAVAALAVSWATHSFIDRRWPVRWLMRRTGSGPFAETTWGVIAVDQALHLSILCLLVGAIS